MSTAKMPPCPLCGASAYNEQGSPRVSCSSDRCRWEHIYFTLDEWRALASPALPKEVVDVLRAAVTYFFGHTKGLGDLHNAITRFDNAGRPGLEEK